MFDEPVLDIGGDDGQFLSRIRAPYKVGLDLTAEPQIEVDWVKADGCQLPFADQSFGHVFAFDIIEHVERDQRLLHEACRLLKPGGTLWISTTASNFWILPGGNIQKRFERSWGHVRRGYTQDMILSRLPHTVEVRFWNWNEPLFRSLYPLLYVLKRIDGRVAADFAGWLATLDARMRDGDSGHVFARVQQPPGNHV